MVPAPRCSILNLNLLEKSAKFSIYAVKYIENWTFYARNYLDEALKMAAGGRRFYVFSIF